MCFMESPFEQKADSQTQQQDQRRKRQTTPRPSRARSSIQLIVENNRCRGYQASRTFGTYGT
jgi:hypothetical protein